MTKLSKLKHKNINKIKECIINRKEIYIISEYINDGEIIEFLKRNRSVVHVKDKE